MKAKQHSYSLGLDENICELDVARNQGFTFMYITYLRLIVRTLN
jgi:hypothetical protein